MPRSRIASVVQKTRDYLESPAGRRQWKENQFAHGFGFQKNLVAAIQAANPEPWTVRYEVLEAIMAELGDVRVAA